MGISIQEQETTINFYRNSDIAQIYTSDSTMITRLDKLAESDDAPEWKLVEVHRSMADGSIVAKTYETKKRLVSFRAAINQRELTEEQREELRERARTMVEAQKKKREEKARQETAGEGKDSV